MYAEFLSDNLKIRHHMGGVGMDGRIPLTFRRLTSTIVDVPHR